MKLDLETAEHPTVIISGQRRFAAWLVHLFTASGAVFGLLALDYIHRRLFLQAFWLMGAAILIDSVDGVLARWAMTQKAASQVDGALLDNVIDYLNYVCVPAFFMIESELLPDGWRFFAAVLVVLASAYQFAQVDAKTRDHFFKGFPSYWNLVILYFFLWRTAPWINLLVVLILVAAVFVPVKYVYPSRLDYLTRNRWLRRTMLIATLVWGVCMAGLLWLYPATNRLLGGVSIAYVGLYVLVSLYRTFVPLK